MQIDWWTLALQAINFLILVWLLWRVLFRPVKRVIEERKKLAEEAFEEAASKEAEAEKAHARYEADRAKLAEERQAMKKALHQELEQERAKTLEEARSDAETIRADARATRAKERDAALKDLRTQVADMAVEMATRLLETSGADPSPALLLERIDRRLEDLDPVERDRVRHDLEAETARAQVATAAPLAPADEAQFRDRLADRLGHRDKLDFVTDPDLLGGVELRLPHHILTLSWADQLRRAKEHIGDAEDAG